MRLCLYRIGDQATERMKMFVLVSLNYILPSTTPLSKALRRSLAAFLSGFDPVPTFMQAQPSLLREIRISFNGGVLL